MNKCEREFYSLGSLGCKKDLLNPRTIGFMYKQFCQSILRFGLDNLFLRSEALNYLNVRQNILLRNALGFKRYTRLKPLLNEIKVEQI